MAQSAMLGESGYERLAYDSYFTPPWCTEWLLNRLRLSGLVWEPTCGAGHMSKVLLAHGYDVRSTDLVDHGYGDEHGIDFLQTKSAGGCKTIFSNPPYECAEQFIWHALQLMTQPGNMVVMLLRQEYDCAKTRRPLFNHPHFKAKYILTRRPRWVELNPGDGQKRMSPRHNFAFFVWIAGGDSSAAPTLHYLP